MQVADKKHESSGKSRRNSERGRVRSIIFRAIREHLDTILDDLNDYHRDSWKSEVLDEALRLTRTSKCAASMAAAPVLNQILSYQEDVLEPLARESSELDDDTLALLATIILAAESLTAIGEQHRGNTDEAPAGAGHQVAEAVKAYRRFHRLPTDDDENVLSSLLAACRSGVPTKVENDAQGPHETEGPPPDTISPELLAIFREEAEDHVNTIYDGLNRLRDSLGDQDLIQQVRRSAHTLKGAAAAVGLKELSRLAHRMEDLLDQLYDGSLPMTAEIVSLLLSTTDVLHDLGTDQDQPARLLTELGRLYSEYGKYCGDKVPATSDDTQRTQERSHSSNDTDAVTSHGDSPDRTPDDSPVKTDAAARPAHWLRVPATRVDDLSHGVSELIINRTEFEQSVRHIVRCTESLQPVLEQLRAVCRDMGSRFELSALSAPETIAANGTRSARTARSPAHAQLGDFDELEFDRYTNAHSLSQVCAEATNDLNSIAQQMWALCDGFDSLLARQDRLTRDARDRLLQIRMVPFRTLTQRLHRVLRETAASRQKTVELIVEGEETELDKIVLEEITDPLLHLLRNAVDHGVEPMEERLARGKPAAATVHVSVDHHGTQVVIRVRDDGQGIDAERIRQAIVTRGHVAARRAKTLTPVELYSYIFVPGFSTASQLSEISGRGVGMDVVHSQVDKLNGRIDVQSSSGQGTTFTIRLPVTLAVTPALIVESGDDSFAIPMQGIVKIAKAPRQCVDETEAELRVNVDGEAYPLVYLRNHLGLPNSPSRPTPILTLVVVAAADRHVAVAVDQILQRRDVVVKSLGDHLGHVPGLMGATVLGDGRVVPILDPADLAMHPPAGKPPATARQPYPADGANSLLVMVVDDSVSVRHVTSNLVQRAGWNCVAAKDGVDALESLERLPKPPDVFLLDVEMPRMDGYQLLSTLRAQPQFARTPIVMITSRAGEKHRQTAFRLGATQFVAKPVQEEQLVNMIRDLTVFG